MNISPDEAEQALAAIQDVTRKTRRSIVNSGGHIFLIFTGAIWLVGFLANQFLSGDLVGYVWGAASVLGSVLAFLSGSRMNRRVRGPLTATYGRRIGVFWLLLAFFCVAVIAVARPADGKQLTMLIVLFVMAGQMTMGLLFSFSSTWWALPLAAVALAGYFLLPAFFYLWMAVLVGGSMIGLGLYIRYRW